MNHKILFQVLICIGLLPFLSACHEDGGDVAFRPHEAYSCVTDIQEYSPSEFFATFGTNVFAAQAFLGEEVTQLFVPVEKAMLAKQKPWLDGLFHLEQQTLRQPSWTFRTYSFEFPTHDVQGRPVTASAMMALPVSLDPKSQHSVCGVTLMHHPWPADGNDAVPSAVGDAFLLRAFYNQMVVLPDYIGYGTSNDHFYAITEGETNARAAIDCLRAARQIAEDAGVRFDEDCQTENFGISMGLDFALSFQWYVEQRANEEERRLVNLRSSYLGAGSASAGRYLRAIDKEGASLIFNLFMNFFRSFYEVPTSRLGGYEPTDFLNPNLEGWEIKLKDGSMIPYLDYYRYNYPVDFGLNPSMGKEYYEAIHPDMYDTERHRLRMDDPRTRAFFAYLDECDYLTDWHPAHALTYIWSPQDKIEVPSYQESIYALLSAYPDGCRNEHVRKHCVTLPDISQLPIESPQISEMMTHSMLCCFFALDCIAREHPVEAYSY